MVFSSPERTITLLLPFSGKQSSMDEYGSFMAKDVLQVCVREESDGGLQRLVFRGGRKTPADP